MLTANQNSHTGVFKVADIMTAAHAYIKQNIILSNSVIVFDMNGHLYSKKDKKCYKMITL